MHDAVRNSNAYSPLIVPGVAGPSPGPGATAEAVAGFQRAGQLSPQAPRTYLPTGRSENNAMLAVHRTPAGLRNVQS